MTDGPFQIVSSREVHHGRVINVHVDTVCYQGKKLEWEVVEGGNAVVILPLLDADTVVLIHQYRYTAKQFLWEVPAGRAEEGEPFAASAQRELEEECRYRARKLTNVLMYYPSPGVFTEVMHLFIAEGLYAAHDAAPDDDEIISVKPVSVQEMGAMIARSDIRDAKTILSYYYLMAHRGSFGGNACRPGDIS